jgi:hypothetical protein
LGVRAGAPNNREPDAMPAVARKSRRVM